MTTTELTTIAAAVSALSAVMALLLATRQRRRLLSDLDLAHRQTVLASELLRRAASDANIFNGLDLSGRDLARLDLAGKDFTDANLHRADLRESSLKGSRLLRADLREVDLSNASLDDATFLDADLSGADLSACSARGTTFRRANLLGVDASSADFTGADLRDAVLVEADLRGALLERADLRGADLTGARLLPGVRLESLSSESGPATPRVQTSQLEPGTVIQPVYMLIDTSGSMKGSPIASLNLQTQAFIDEFQGDPFLASRVCLSVISFDSEARVVLELTLLSKVTSVPSLAAGGSTSYAAAFRLLRHQWASDLMRMRTAGAKMHRPLVLFLTDGEPTDDGWERELEILAADRTAPKVVAFALGPVSGTTLSRISSVRFQLSAQDGLPQAIRAMGRWLSATVSESARSGDLFALEKADAPSGYQRLD